MGLDWKTRSSHLVVADFKGFPLSQGSAAKKAKEPSFFSFFLLRQATAQLTLIYSLVKLLFQYVFTSLTILRNYNFGFLLFLILLGFI